MGLPYVDPQEVSIWRQVSWVFWANTVLALEYNAMIC
jgi:hypothetical protein